MLNYIFGVSLLLIITARVRYAVRNPLIESDIYCKKKNRIPKERNPHTNPPVLYVLHVSRTHGTDAENTTRCRRPHDTRNVGRKNVPSYPKLYGPTTAQSYVNLFIRLSRRRNSNPPAENRGYVIEPGALVTRTIARLGLSIFGKNIRESHETHQRKKNILCLSANKIDILMATRHKVIQFV